MGITLKAWMVVPGVIGCVAGVFGALGHGVASAAGLPVRLELPLAVRGIGAAVLAFGFLFMAWLFKYRKPVDVLVSTYVTMRWAVRQHRPDPAAARTEPLVLQGPQRHVRHPMYFAVVVMVLGGWLVLDYTLILFMAIFFCIGFNAVVIPFEEKELRVLYGEAYEAYVRSVPRFFPSVKRLKRRLRDET